MLYKGLITVDIVNYIYDYDNRQGWKCFTVIIDSGLFTYGNHQIN